MSEQSKKILGLDELKNQYVQLGVQIAKSQLEQRGLSYDIEQLLQTKSDLENRVKMFERYDHLLQNLSNERGDIGLLAIGERIDHEEKIMGMKAKKANEVKKLYTDYQVKPDGIPEKWQSIDRQITEHQSKLSKISERITEFEMQQKEVGQEYKIVHSREPADARSTTKQSQGNRPDKNTSLTDKMAISKAENELANLTKPDNDREHTHEHRRERK